MHDSKVVACLYSVDIKLMHPESGAVGQEIPNGRLSTNRTIFLPFHRKTHLYFWCLHSPFGSFAAVLFLHFCLVSSVLLHAWCAWTPDPQPHRVNTPQQTFQALFQTPLTSSAAHIPLPGVSLFI